MFFSEEIFVEGYNLQGEKIFYGTMGNFQKKYCPFATIEEVNNYFLKNHQMEGNNLIFHVVEPEKYGYPILKSSEKDAYFESRNKKIRKNCRIKKCRNKYF